MSSQTLTHADFRSIATAAGCDLNAHGGMSHFARTLGLNPQQVSSALRSTADISGRVAAAATDLIASLADGTVTLSTPASSDALADIATLQATIDPDSLLSDEALIAKTNKRFGYMMRYVKGGVQGKLGRFNCVLVTGPGGIGKTHPIEAYLNNYKIEKPGKHVEFISGGISAVKLVEALHNCQCKGDVLVLDDADEGLKNSEFLAVLKAATDPKTSRTVSWLKQNNKLAEAGVPEQFDFNGTVIIISNINVKLAAEKGAKAPHMDAILSRARHIDLGINSSRALALRVKYMIEEVEMFAQDFAAAGMSELHDQAKGEIGQWIVDHKDDFRSLTLREACKIASCYIMCEGEPEWAEMAKMELGSF